MKKLAKLSFGAGGLFLILLALLHFLKPDYDPTWHMISEYEIGTYGWVMQAAFVSTAISCIALVFALSSQTKNIIGRIGLFLLILAGVGMTIAGFNITDPIGTPPNAMSAHANLHGLGFMIGVPSLTLGILFLTLSLRKNPLWKSLRDWLLTLAILPWVSILAMGYGFAVLLPANGGHFGPSVLIGIPNRLYMVFCIIWLMVASSHVITLSQKRVK